MSRRNHRWDSIDASFGKHARCRRCGMYRTVRRLRMRRPMFGNAYYTDVRYTLARRGIQNDPVLHPCDEGHQNASDEAIDNEHPSMIENERQYKITRAAVDRFARALEHFDDTPGTRKDVHPRLLQAERDALVSQLEELTGELQAYRRVRGTPTY